MTFKNKPTTTGFETFTIADCTIGHYGSAQASRPQIVINLPKADNRDVTDSFVKYEGEDYHVIGVAAVSMEGNTPTRWNRYAIAERIRAL